MRFSKFSPRLTWRTPARLVQWLSLSALLLLTACASKEPMPPAAADSASTQVDPQLQAKFDEAVALKQAGKPAEAGALFLALHQAHPQLTGPLANLGFLALEQGKREQAQSYFQQVLAINPSHPHVLNGLGVLAREQGQFEAAESYYRAALKADPNYRPALKNLAILLELYQGRLEEALALVEQYQALQTEADPKLKDWIFDLQSRLQ